MITRNTNIGVLQPALRQDWLSQFCYLKTIQTGVGKQEILSCTIKLLKSQILLCLHISSNTLYMLSLIPVTAFVDESNKGSRNRP